MRILLTVTVVAVALTGCLDGNTLTDSLGATDARADEALVLPWRLTDCDAVIGVVPVSVDALAPHVPEGFAPVPPEALGLPDDPRGDALLGFETILCKSITGVETTPYGHFGSLFTFVTPPTDLAEDVTYHFVKWDVTLDDAGVTDALRAAGAPVRDGEGVRFGALPEAYRGVQKGPLQAALYLDSDAYGFNGVAFDDWTQAMEGKLTEWTPLAEGGFAVWRAAFTWDVLHTGTGYMRVPAGSWAHDVVGEDRAPAYFLFGRTTFDGTVTIPATS